MRRMDSGHVASALWVGSEEYEPEGKFERRVAEFYMSIKWDALCLLSSRLRHGIKCELKPKFAIGHSNMVRHIVFADGQNWVARLRMPPLDECHGELPSAAQIFDVEIASMRLLR